DRPEEEIIAARSAAIPCPPLPAGGERAGVRGSFLIGSPEKNAPHPPLTGHLLPASGEKGALQGGLLERPSSAPYGAPSPRERGEGRFAPASPAAHNIRPGSAGTP